MDLNPVLIMCSRCHIEQPIQNYYSKNKTLKTCWSCRYYITCVCGHRTNTDKNHTAHVLSNHKLPFIEVDGYVVEVVEVVE